jgi:hypothetical protein
MKFRVLGLSQPFFREYIANIGSTFAAKDPRIIFESACSYEEAKELEHYGSYDILFPMVVKLD